MELVKLDIQELGYGIICPDLAKGVILHQESTRNIQNTYIIYNIGVIAIYFTVGPIVINTNPIYRFAIAEHIYIRVFT